MSDELVVSLLSASVAVVAGLIVRWQMLGDNQSLTLGMLDFTRDLFAAAAAVFPTTLVLQGTGDIKMEPGEFVSVLVLVASIGIWARGDSRYFEAWRNGQKRVKDGNKLGPPVPADNPQRRKMAAFVLGNLVGLAVLLSSSVIALKVAA